MSILVRTMKASIRRSLLLLLSSFPCLSLSAFDRDPALVGRWPAFGGAALTAVVVEGDHAYCGTEKGLLILDVGTPPDDPLNVDAVGSWEGGSPVGDLVVSNNLVYVGSGGSLVVIDVSAPSRPREIGRFDGRYGVRALASAGHHVFVVGRVLQVFDVSDPADPRPVTEFASGGGNFWDVDVVGNRAYVADQTPSGGLRILDVSDPARPRQLGTLDEIGSTVDVVVADGFAYVMSQHVGGVIADVRDPAEPRSVERFSGAAGLLAVSGNRLVAGSRIYDISNPEEFDGNLTRFLEFFSEAEDVFDLFVADGRIYVAGRSGLEVFDLPEPRAPEELAGILESTNASTVFLDGNHAYVNGRAEGQSFPGLEVIDVSDPAAPQRVGILPELPGEIDGASAIPEDIFVAGNHAYVAGGRGGLRVVDVSDSTEPEQVAMVDTEGRARSVWVAGGHAYVTSGRRLMVLDVSNPREPTLVGEERIFRGRDLFVAGGFAYVVNNAVLDIIDVRDPRNPTTAGQFDAFAGEREGGGVFVSGNFAYVADGVTGLLIVDVSDPARPQLADRVPREFAGHVVISGDVAYLGVPGGFEVIDVSDPAAPRPMDRYLFSAGEFAVSGGLVYGPAGSAGFRVIDTSVPPTPPVTPVRLLETSVVIEDAAVAGGHAYVVDPDAGLHVFDIADPARPRRVAREPRVRGQRVFVSGGVAYVIGHIGVQGAVIDAVDISDPDAPRVAGRYEAGATAKHLSLTSGYAYLLHEVFGAQPREIRIQVIDVRDPAAMRQVGEYATTGESHGLFVSADFSYLSVESDLEVIDLTEPAAPRRLSRQERPFGLPLVLSGERAYAAYWGPQTTGLEVFDVSAPLNPMSLGRYAGRTGGPLAASGEIVYSESHQNFGEEGFHLLDVSDPAQPRLVARRPNSELKAVAGSHAVTRESGLELRILDVDRPANPQRVGAFDALGDTAERGGIALAGNHAYVANGDSGLLVLDVSAPSAPSRVADHDTMGTAEAVFVSGGVAYVADGFDGLEVIDIGDPASPRRLGEIEVLGEQGAGYAYDVFVAGDEAYVANWTSPRTGSLEVIDVSDPAGLERLARFVTSHVADSVSVSEGHAFAASREVEVIDVNDPSRPRRVSTLPGGPGDVLVLDRYAYVAGESALRVFDVRDPANPELVGIYPLRVGATVHAGGAYAYVLDRLAGLEVIDVSDPAAPRRVGGNSAVLRSRNDGSLALAVGDGRVYVGAGGDGFSVLEFRAPFPPTNVIAQAGDGEVELSWSAPPGGLAAAGYEVWRVDPDPRLPVNTQPVRGTSFTVRGLENGVEHCFVVRALSRSGEASIDSAPTACATPRAPAPRFLRGDCDGDGRVGRHVTDAVFLLSYSFLGGRKPPCLAACDVNGDGRAAGQITDAVYLLNYNFLGGAAPVDPFPDCGPGLLETDRVLGCEEGCP